MPRFKPGDRVELTGDIARFYPCAIGVVHQSSADITSVLAQYRVRFANGMVGTFYDFQLQSPPIVRAHVVFDSATAPSRAGTRGLFDARHILLAAAGVEIHIKILKGVTKSIMGQVTAAKSSVAGALVTLVIEDSAVTTHVTEDDGEFKFSGLTGGEVTLETFVPGKRVVATLNISESIFELKPQDQ